MAINQTGADAYFKTQLTNSRWKAVANQGKAITMAITDIATALGYDDDADLDEDNQNMQYACYEQALYLGENLDSINTIQNAEIANLESQRVDGLGEETYKSDGKIQSINGIVLAPRANLYLRRIRGPFRAVR